MIEKITDGLAINFPWVPDLIQAYKFGSCVLCLEEKKINPKFKSDGCIHCKKETKMMVWGNGRT